METKLGYKTKIACVLLNTWALELDLPNKMIYMDICTVVIFFHKLWHFLNFTDWSSIWLPWEHGKCNIAKLFILSLRIKHPSVYTLYRILVSYLCCFEIIKTDNWIWYIIVKTYYLFVFQKEGSVLLECFVWPLSWQRHDNHSFPLALGLSCHKETNVPKFHLSIPFSSRDGAILTFFQNLDSCISSAKPRPMKNVISQSLGLDLFNINVYAKGRVAT